MGTKSKKIDALDEMLRYFVLEKGAKIDNKDKLIEQVSETVFNTPLEVTPSDEKSSELLQRLQSALKEFNTFGDLLTVKIKQKNIELDALSNATQLPTATIEQLIQDALFPNHVPVLLIKRLIQFLDIPLDNAKRALQRTADFIAKDLSLKETSRLASTSARRRSRKKSHEIQKDTMTEAINPGVAKSSMEIYLQRLEEILIEEKSYE